MELISVALAVLLTCSFHVNVFLVETALIEPMCSKFAYEEQLLEKMVRMEFYMENLEKDLRKTVTESVQTMTKKQDDNAKLIQTLVDQSLHDNSNITSLAAQLEDLKQEFTEFQRQTKETTKSADNVPRIAFNVREATDLSLKANQVIVFKTVILNLGEAYKEDEGAFYAPEDGLYQFNAHLCVVHGGKDLDYAIMVDSTPISSGEYRAPSDATDGKCVSFSAVALVNKSQKVTVSFKDGSTSTEDNLFQNDNDWNSFSGVLIHTI